MIDVTHIRAIADEVILQITMGCRAYRAGDTLAGELHMSLGQAALLKLQRLLDEPAQKPMRKLAIVGPRDEEDADRLLPGWFSRKANDNGGDGAA